MRKIINGQVQCARCGETKPVAAFCPRPPSGHPRSWCKKCENAQSTIHKRRKREAAKAGRPPKANPGDTLKRRQRAVPVVPLKTDDETRAIMRAKWADKQFKLRMLAARDRRQENFIVGVMRAG